MRISRAYRTLQEFGKFFIVKSFGQKQIQIIRKDLKKSENRNFGRFAYKFDFMYELNIMFIK